MVDLIEFKLNANDKISSNYINDENFNVCFLDNINKVKKAVLETKGEYISYDNKVAEALFFSIFSIAAFRVHS